MPHKKKTVKNAGLEEEWSALLYYREGLCHKTLNICHTFLDSGVIMITVVSFELF